MTIYYIDMSQITIS